MVAKQTLTEYIIELPVYYSQEHCTIFFKKISSRTYTCCWLSCSDYSRDRKGLGFSRPCLLCCNQIRNSVCFLLSRRPSSLPSFLPSDCCRFFCYKLSNSDISLPSHRLTYLPSSAVIRITWFLEAVLQ